MLNYNMPKIRQKTKSRFLNTYNMQVEKIIKLDDENEFLKI